MTTDHLRAYIFYVVLIIVVSCSITLRFTVKNRTSNAKQNCTPDVSPTNEFVCWTYFFRTGPTKEIVSGRKNCVKTKKKKKNYDKIYPLHNTHIYACSVVGNFAALNEQFIYLFEYLNCVRLLKYSVKIGNPNQCSVIEVKKMFRVY